MSDVYEIDEVDILNTQSPPDPSILKPLNADHFNPPVTLESNNFILPEDKVEVHIVPRERSFKIIKYALRTGPLYLTTCYEEFSRKLISVHIASESPSELRLSKNINIENDSSNPNNLLKYYNPGYEFWRSTFKRNPVDPKLFNGDEYNSNFSLLVKIHKCNLKQKVFEPIFGSLCLYTFFNDEFIRITETFYFDATPENIRQLYKKVYLHEGQHNSNVTPYFGTSINVADATQLNPHLNMFLLTLPKELKFQQEIYLIVQLNKVLTNDPEKAILPYCKGGTSIEQQKLKESADRLNKFRQPLGFGIGKVVFDSQGNLSRDGSNLSFPFYAQKLCFTDVAFAQAIREMYPIDGSSPYYRFEQLEIDMHMSLYDLGPSEQYLEKLKDLHVIPDNEKPHVIEGEIPSEMSQLVFAPEASKLDHLGKQAGSLAIRKVLSIVPNSIPWMRSLSKQIKTKVENSMFLYVLQFDRFPSSSRNLCLKMEVVEFKSQFVDQKLPTENLAHDVLPNIYNYSTLLGPHLVKETYSRVSYHMKNSPANDEFKIRLPDVLTARHWIKFSIHHVHVKTHTKGSLVGAFTSNRMFEKEGQESVVLGYGYLPLHAQGGALIPDAEHIIPIYQSATTPSSEQFLEIPIIRVRTRSLCSLVSSDRYIQSLIRNIPLPLGYLPSSVMPEAIAAQLIIKSSSIRPKEETLETNLEDLPKASVFELSQNLLVIMRTLVRALLAGTGVYEEVYANPFKHCKARCRSFLTLLKVFDKIIQGASTRGFEDEKEREILEAYVDFVLDEEVPLEGVQGSERLSIFVDSFNNGLDAYDPRASVGVGMAKSRSFGNENDIILPKKGLSSSNLLNRSRKNSLDGTPTAPEVQHVEVNNAIQDDSKSDDSGDYHLDHNNDIPNRTSELYNSPLSPVLAGPVRTSSPTFHPAASVDSNNAVVVAAGPDVYGNVELNEPPARRASRKITEEEYNAANVNTSDKRRSWGKYITDSHWSTGKFVPINEITEDKSNAANAQSNACLESIAEYITNQAIRIIEERLIGIAVYAMTSIVRLNTDSVFGDQNDITERSILDNYNRPSRYSSKIGIDSWTFPFSKTPIEPDTTAHLNSEKSELLIDDPLIDLLISRSTWIKPSGDTTTLSIPQASPLFDSLAGYRDRSSPSDDIASVAGKHWWPWLYEVITFQWGAVLALILSSMQLISSNNLDSIVGSYQFEFELSTPNSDPGKRDWRTILMEEGPLLLRIIYKSLALRIQRERKRAPIILDDQYFNALENLVMLIAVEASTTVAGLWRSKRIISSLAYFLRSLFALVIPSQVIRLLKSFFRTIRKSRGKNEEVDLRLLLLEELSYFDYLVALNLPYSLDAPLSCFSFSIVDPLTGGSSNIPSLLSLANPYTSIGLRLDTSQVPYSLTHLIISEIMFSIRQDYRKREKGWEILRDLIVRHAYDSRYQSKESQQRIMCMYLPLIHEITNEVNYLSNLKHNSAERREALSVLLYILSCAPQRILRSRIRNICLKAYEDANNTTPAASPAASNKANPSPMTDFTDSSDKFIARNAYTNPFITDFIRIMHLIIDTFEIPSFSTNPYDNAAGGKDDPYLKLLSPSTENLVKSENEKIVRKTSIGVTSLENIPTNPRQSMASALLSKLDQQMQTRKTTSLSTRKSATGTLKTSDGPERGWIEHARRVINNDKDKSTIIKPISREDAQIFAEKFSSSSIKIMLNMMWIIFEECPRIIIEHAQSNYSTASAKDVSPVAGHKSMSQSGKLASFASLSNLFSATASGNVNGSTTSQTTIPLRQNYLEESINISDNTEKELVAFMREALCIPLHALYCNQIDTTYAEIYTFISSIVKKFGSKIFLASLEDSLQYWLRITLIHFASESLLVRHTACNFFLTLLHTTFQYFGTFAMISTTVLAIFNDVCHEILEASKHLIQTYSDEDRELQGLIDTFKQIKQINEKVLKNLKKQKFHALSNAIVSFVKSIEIIFRANSDVRRYLALPAVYDFYGANLLDGPFDERTSLLLQVIKQNRKNIKNDNDSSGPATSTTGATVKSPNFQLEEVMYHFLEAAEVYDVYKLPRFKMQWLENLARLHQSRLNRAEGAEIRWRIFLLCQQIEDRWQKMWSPRPPLQWQRRGKNIDISASNNNNTTGGNTTNNGSTTNGSPAGANNNNNNNSGNSGNNNANNNSNNSNSPPAPIVSENENRDFYRILMSALDSKMLHPWLDINQYWIHKITSLTVSRQFYTSVNLMSLAERASKQLIYFYRLTQQTSSLIEEYNNLGTTWKTTFEKGITNDIALGTFYRVYYLGLGTPEHLREKEFIFRNANHLHVSEFHSLVISHLKSIVNEGIEVKMIQDSATVLEQYANHKDAFIIMNSVKPIRIPPTNTVNTYKLITSNETEEDKFSLYKSLLACTNYYAINQINQASQAMNNNNDFALLNQQQVLMFQYSVPFTQDGSNKTHAKKMEDQWTKETILVVKESFPYVLTRQQVSRREVKILSPIEVAIHDIEERIESMEKELELMPKTQSDINNLMRIVQGTVLPQVNAGASELAKVFLNNDKLAADLKILQTKINGIISNEIKLKEHRYQLKLIELQNEFKIYQQQILRLKVALINFLQFSRLLLLKCRNILINENNSTHFTDRSKILERPTGYYANTNAMSGDMNELMLLTYPSILSNNSAAGGLNNPLQSVNLNSVNLMMAGGNGLAGGLPGASARASMAMNGNTTTTMMLGNGMNTASNIPNPPMTSPLNSLWKGSSSENSSNRDTGNLNNSAMNNNNGPSNGNIGGGGGNNANNNNNNPPQGPVALTAQEINNLKWQMEMEKGFDVLVQSIYPYIADIKEAEIFYLPSKSSVQNSGKE